MELARATASRPRTGSTHTLPALLTLRHFDHVPAHSDAVAQLLARPWAVLAGAWGLAAGGAGLLAVLGLSRPGAARWVLAWLRQDAAKGQPSAPAHLQGLWARRWIACAASCASVSRQSRFQRGAPAGLSAALQASPNGVILLDAEGPWSNGNQTAARHFGLEPLRPDAVHRQPGCASFRFQRPTWRRATMPAVAARARAQPLQLVQLSVRLHPMARAAADARDDAAGAGR